MPFYSASLVETVQSDIASEKPGIFDVFREGAHRLLAFHVPQKGRMIPIWGLIGPSIALGISKYIFGWVVCVCDPQLPTSNAPYLFGNRLAVKSISMRLIQYRIRCVQERRGVRPKDNELEYQNVEIYSTLVSLMTTEILFFPFETILHRLQLQGTRTIIDNLDTGYSVVPILTSYEGAVDCCRSTIASEGVPGLYKG